MKIPTSPQTLSAAWLTEALRRSQAINQARVTTYDIQLLKGQEGLTIQVARLRLDYDRPEADAPRSLIAKFSPLNPESRKISQRSYEKEVRFYQQIASHIELRVPHCYYSDHNPETHEHVLLLEDFTPARNPDWEEGCTLAQADHAIQRIANFHATCWNNPAIVEKGWILPFDPGRFRQYQADRLEHLWQVFIEKVGADLPADIRQLGVQLQNRWADMTIHLHQPPVTFCHGSYQLDNLFFATPQGGLPFALIDWQVYSMSRGVYDLAYFLGTGLRPEVRQRNELTWLKTYHQILQARGIADYPFEQCLSDYRLSLLHLLMRQAIVIGRQPLSPEQEYLRQKIFLTRFCAAILDFDGPRVLAELDNNLITAE